MNTRIFIAAALALALLLGVGCSSTQPSGTSNDQTGISVQEPSNNSQDDAPTSEPVSGPENDQVQVEEQVIYDAEGLKVTLKSMNMKGLFGPSLKVLIENGTEQSIMVQTRNTAINGVMIEGMFSCDVAPNKSANSEITFLQSDLDLAEISVIKDIEFTLHVSDAETWDTLIQSDTILITTSADSSYVQAYNDMGAVALDQDGFKLVVQKLDNQDSFWGADIYVYIENNSNTNATIQVRDVSINGFMVEPIFSSEVLAGKRAYDTITFFESDLIENDISSIGELELSFHVFKTDSWDTIFDTDPVVVTFED